MNEPKPILFLNPIQPLPCLKPKIERMFLGKLVVVRHSGSETFAFGKLLTVEFLNGRLILILENFGKKMILADVDLIKVI